ncbi:MAG: hypothetical protein WAW52_01770 [Methanothrix sp.]
MLANLVRVVSSTVGTGAITLGAAVSGCLTFAGAGIADGSIVSYGITDGINSEVGRGVYNAGTLSRSLILASTNSGAAINLSGSEQVFITVLAQDVPSMEGWYRFWNTATYVSPTSFSLPGDFTAFFKIGVKIRVSNSGIKYGHCLSSSLAGGITTVNLVQNTSFSLANAAITNIDISYGNPPDFPYWFNYNITGIANSNVILNGRYNDEGRTCKVQFKAAFTGGITFTTMPTLPIAASASMLDFSVVPFKPVGYLDSGTAWVVANLYMTIMPGATTFSLKAGTSDMSATNPITWANGDVLGGEFEYEV